jgi:flagellar hook-associated protein 1 FlgK
MVVRSDILADPAKLALADLDTSAATGTPALSVADGRGAVSLQEIIDANISFAATDELAATSTTLSNYAGSILENAAINADQADKLQADRAALQEELQVRNDEISGVNLDEELSNMIIYQNAYNAAARMITTSQEMFDTLARLVG